MRDEKLMFNMKKWVCTVCGYIYEGEEPPEKCPVCGVNSDKFVEKKDKLDWADEHHVGCAKGIDEDLLEDLINQAEGLNSANYTEASYKVLNEALVNAKAVYENPNATQEEVNSAKDVLEKAINSLEVITTVDNTPSTPVDNGDTTSVKTGDESLSEMFASIALLSVAGYTVLKRKLK